MRRARRLRDAGGALGPKTPVPVYRQECLEALARVEAEIGGGAKPAPTS